MTKPKVRHHIYYWPTFESAREVANSSGFLAARVIEYEVGWAVQIAPGSKYLGDDNDRPGITGYKILEPETEPTYAEKIKFCGACVHEEKDTTRFPCDECTQDSLIAFRNAHKELWEKHRLSPLHHQHFLLHQEKKEKLKHIKAE